MIKTDVKRGGATAPEGTGEVRLNRNTLNIIHPDIMRTDVVHHLTIVSSQIGEEGTTRAVLTVTSGTSGTSTTNNRGKGVRNRQMTGDVTTVVNRVTATIGTIIIEARIGTGGARIGTGGARIGTGGARIGTGEAQTAEVRTGGTAEKTVGTTTITTQIGEEHLAAGHLPPWSQDPHQPKTRKSKRAKRQRKESIRKRRDQTANTNRALRKRKSPRRPRRSTTRKSIRRKVVTRKPSQKTTRLHLRRRRLTSSLHPRRQTSMQASLPQEKVQKEMQRIWSAEKPNSSRLLSRLPFKPPARSNPLVWPLKSIFFTLLFVKKNIDLPIVAQINGLENIIHILIRFSPKHHQLPSVRSGSWECFLN